MNSKNGLNMKTFYIQNICHKLFHIKKLKHIKKTNSRWKRQIKSSLVTYPKGYSTAMTYAFSTSAWEVHCTCSWLFSPMGCYVVLQGPLIHQLILLVKHPENTFLKIKSFFFHVQSLLE